MCKYKPLPQDEPPKPICLRCKQPCKVVHDKLEHEFGSTPFIESDCCGAPVAYPKGKTR